MATQKGFPPELVQVLASYFAQNGSPGFPVEGAQPTMSQTPEAMQPLVPHSVPDPWGGQPIPTFVPPIAGGFQAPPEGGGGGGMPLALLAGMAAKQQGQMPPGLGAPKQPYHPGVGNMTVSQPSQINMMAPPSQPQNLATLIQALSGLRR
jgi:hypothetical protein